MRCCDSSLPYSMQHYKQCAYLRSTHSTHFPNLLRDRRRTYMLGIVAIDTHAFMLGVERQHAVGIWRPNEFVPRSVDIDLTFRVDPRCDAESQTRCEQWKGDSDGERMAWHRETTLRPTRIAEARGQGQHCAFDPEATCKHKNTVSDCP